jgi:proteasome lid subunit RPN8/RPN11
MLDHMQVAKICMYAEQASPFECCGIIGEDGRVLPCGNVARFPTHQFEIAPRDLAFIKLKHGIAGIYHSHLNCGPAPSAADLQRAEYYDLPYYIVSVRLGTARDLSAHVLAGPPDKKRFIAKPELLPKL